MLKQLLDNNKDNFLYVPGIATYGIDGKTGETGDPGNCIFYSNYSIEDNGGETSESDLNLILKLISQNKTLIKYHTVELSRKYIDGDYIIFSSGDIYRLSNIALIDTSDTAPAKEDFFERVGKLSTQNDSSNYFAVNSTNRIALDSSYSGLDLFYKNANVSELQEKMQGTEGYVLRIVNETDDTNKVFFVSMSSKYDTNESNYLNIYFDEADKAFHIDSNKDVLLNAKTLFVKTDSNVNSYDNYSSVMTWDNPVTEFIKIVKNFTYSIEGKTLSLSYNGDDLSDIVDNKERFDSSLYVRSYDSASGMSKMMRYEFNPEVGNANYMIDISSSGDEIQAVSFIYNIECFVKQA